ncbi:MAG TPA: translation initiation factor IF-2 [Methylomusa anaerophila]|uniref:Translation initiation factor IF-2 n=1 Tax=Methylomusa anaerophila TaxID=1930071 RepID=A0A348APY9_9FIRM|nr:translation initiation factor IF-2 [Methylomusa anaerophila]BBB93137.1 translation initiation factor IF-2 [Methylomusa anaerophila]HML87030.1 translation initiation factor IF-2 [Methylomusa anaerophila]
MSKYRVYELAKEFNTSSKVIIDILGRHSVTAKNHMSSVDEDAKQVIEHTFARKTGPVEENKSEKQPINAQVNQPVDNQRQRPHQSQQSQQSTPQVQVQQLQHHQSDRQNVQRQQFSNKQYQPRGQNGGLPQQQRPFQRQNQSPQNQSPQQRQQYPTDRPNQQRSQQNNQGFSGGQQNNNYRSNPQAQANRLNQQRPQWSNQNQDRPGQNRPVASTAGVSQIQQTAHNNRPSNVRTDKQQGQHSQGRRPMTPHSSGPKSSGTGGQGGRQNQHQNRHIQNSRNPQANIPAPAKAEPPKPKVIKLGESISVKDLASKLGREVSEVIKKLMLLGIMASINQEVDFETASILASEFGTSVEELPPEEDPTEIPEIEDDPKDLVYRHPVVTVMGHVDHGKTSLLDTIRQTNVTAQEAGGITQHIGAYQVMCQGKKIVFLDTPGHEAFTAMRARGAQVTDIAILVVAADDGVMPQTIEAINHAKSAQVPIIVAINKIDREGANPDRVKQQLSEHGLIPEDWGGDTIMVPVSAHKKTGLNELLEMVLLVAEMLDLKANPNRAAYGTIIEAKLDKGRGVVATVLVQKGTLRIGDSIIAGTAFGKVRAMINDRSEKVKKAEPSAPVEVLGLAEVPQAGDNLVAVDEKTARIVAEKRLAKKRTEEQKQSQKVSLDELFKQIQEGNLKDLNIIVKADVQGSIEALQQSLVNLQNKEVRVNIIHAGVGAINESDVMLASTSNGLIIGFNVRPDGNARKAAENENIDIRTYRVIYDAINDVEAAINGMLAPELKEVIHGRAEVRQVFNVPKAVVAGSYVLEGKITGTSQIRLIRNGIVVHEGKVESLRRFKDDVKEIAQGYECGISLEKYRDIKEGDIMEAFSMEEVAQKPS